MENSKIKFILPSFFILIFIFVIIFFASLSGKQCKLNGEIVKKTFAFHFFSDFHENSHNFDMENSKIYAFASISQKWLTK